MQYEGDDDGKVYQSLCVVTHHEELKQLKLYHHHKKKFKDFLRGQDRMRTAFEAGHTIEGYLAYSQDQRPNMILAMDGISEISIKGDTSIQFEEIAENIASFWKQSSPSLRNFFFEDAQKNEPHANERVFRRFLPWEVAQLLNALEENNDAWCMCDSDDEGH